MRPTTLDHPKRGHVEVKQRFCFFALGLILLAQADDRANGLGVEALSPLTVFVADEGHLR